jgi:hypothetical protein
MLFIIGAKARNELRTVPAVARGELLARPSSVGVVVVGGDGPVDRWGAVPAGVPAGRPSAPSESP